MSAEAFVLGSRDFGEEVAACIQIDPRSHLRLNSTESRALHRYLSGLVLPTVEREGQASFCSRPCSGTWVGLTNERRFVGTLGKFFTPEGARALAACLLAAADEAEGVA